MTTAVQHRRGTTAEHSTFTGLEGEVTIDTTKDTAVIHDGVLAGGYPLAKENLANVTTSGLASIDGASTASDDKFFIYDQSATTLKTITRAELNNAIEQDALANVAITGGTINGTSVGATTASSGAFTTLSASGAVTLSGGTANGVAYLNGSKVLTTGSALTFDGASLRLANAVGTTANGLRLDGGAQAHYWYLSDNVTSAYEIGSGSGQWKWLNSNGEQMRLTSTGLGIGKSSPSAPLDLVGTFRWNSNTGGTDVWQRFSGGTGLIYDGTTTATDLAWIRGGSEQMRLTSTGLGISAGNAPTQALNLYRSGSTQVVMAAGNSNTGLNGTYFGVDTAGNAIINQTQALATIFSINGSEKMRLTSTGLGIGTSSPSAKLEVAGSAKLSSADFVDFTIDQTDSGKMAIGVSSATAGAFINAVGNGAYAGQGYIRFLSENVEKMRLDSSGNLGLGVTPSAWSGGVIGFQSTYGVLSGNSQVNVVRNAYYGSGGWTYTSSSTASLYAQISGEHRWSIAPSGTAGNAITFTQAMTLDASGQLGIGATSPARTLDVRATSPFIRIQETGSGGDKRLEFSVDSGGVATISAPQSAQVLTFNTVGSERARIDSSGNFLVNSTSSTPANDANSGFCAGSTSGFGSTWVKIPNNAVNGYGAFTIYRGSSVIGSISYNGTGVNYNNTSDYRLKTVIGAVTGAGQRIDALQPVEYEWKADGSRARGFLAHQFQEVYAGSVTGSKDAVDANGNPVYQSMQASTSEVIADLVAELQSLRKRVAELEAK